MHYEYKMKVKDLSKGTGQISTKYSYAHDTRIFKTFEIGNKDAKLKAVKLFKRSNADYNLTLLNLKHFSQAVKRNSLQNIAHGKEDWEIIGNYKQVNMESSIEEEFYRLAKLWKRETSMYSFISRKIMNPNYISIIGLGVVHGEPITKLILKDLENGTEFWHYALKKINSDNPVPKGAANNLQKVRTAWLAWGKEKQII